MSVIIAETSSENLQRRVKDFYEFLKESMNESQTNTYEFEEFRIDGSKRLLIKENDEIIPLTPKVFDLLFYLVQNSGRVIEKDELMTAIWTDTIVEESNLSQNISILRRVLGEKRGEHRFIATIPGHGYKFVANVSRIGEEEIRNESTAAEQSAVEDGFNSGELHISDDRFQNKARKPKIEDQIRIPKSAFQNRIWLSVLTVLSLFTLGAAFFFFGAETKNLPTCRLKPSPFCHSNLSSRNNGMRCWRWEWLTL